MLITKDLQIRVGLTPLLAGKVHLSAMIRHFHNTLRHSGFMQDRPCSGPRSRRGLGERDRLQVTGWPRGRCRYSVSPSSTSREDAIKFLFCSTTDKEETYVPPEGRCWLDLEGRSAEKLTMDKLVEEIVRSPTTVERAAGTRHTASPVPQTFIDRLHVLKIQGRGKGRGVGSICLPRNSEGGRLLDP